ncbi:MAG: hypothetical protein V3W34_10310 [Phycisphaerae bacterium]
MKNAGLRAIPLFALIGMILTIAGCPFLFPPSDDPGDDGSGDPTGIVDPSDGNGGDDDTTDDDTTDDDATDDDTTDDDTTDDDTTDDDTTDDDATDDNTTDDDTTGDDATDDNTTDDDATDDNTTGDDPTDDDTTDDDGGGNDGGGDDGGVTPDTDCILNITGLGTNPGQGSGTSVSVQVRFDAPDDTTLTVHPVLPFFGSTIIEVPPGAERSSITFECTDEITFGTILFTDQMGTVTSAGELTLARGTDYACGEPFIVAFTPPPSCSVMIE